MREAIRRVAAFKGDIVVVVGAGASMEAGLPSWPGLVRRLLQGSASSLLPEEHRQVWMETIEEEGLLAAAAVVRALSASDKEFRARLRGALYEPLLPSQYHPQALAQQIAWMKARDIDSVRIATGNYDGLLEQALQDRGLSVHSYVIGHAEPPGSAAVYHLHGRLVPDYPSTGSLVLSEDDYARVQYPGSWQERFMREALETKLCLFVGLSLTDPNLIRWLYRYAARDTTAERHIALFVRQASPQLHPAVRDQLEHAARQRWDRCGVEAIWADFFGESAQFIHEIALSRGGSSAPGFAERARERFETARRVIAPGKPKLFREAQERATTFLSEQLEYVRSIAKTGDVDLSEEHLGLGLWVVDHDRGTVGCWATADRRLNDSSSIASQPLAYDSPWVAVEAITRGVVVQRDPDVFASRWRLIRGIPIIVQDPDGAGRTIAGAMTLTSTTPEKDSALSSAPRGVLGAIDSFLAGPVALLFQP
jgi:SIR2-like domain